MAVLAVAIGMMILERVRPGRRLPGVRGWWTRALILNGIQAAMVLIAGVAWDRWMPGKGLWDASRLGTAGGALVGYLAITFIYYWWHRARHEIPMLWRWLHQLHHSAARIEIVTSFYKHPLEILLNSILSSAILFMLVGITPQAAALATLITGLAELFYHWNVRTPYWLGFFLQRPESHCVHHQRGRHRNNYSDLPLWDILFGTFENPRECPDACGFDPDRAGMVGRMLLGHDLHVRSSE